MPETCDVAVIGAGPAGLTAGIYLARAGLKAVLFDKGMPGGQLATTDVIENYPGIPEPVGGMELSMRMAEQVKGFGAQILTVQVTGLKIDGDRKVVVTSKGEWAAAAAIVATGARHGRLNVPGETCYWGKGISCCATCDGVFFKGKEVVVVGGGDAAVKESLFLTRFASRITLIHRRDRLRATKVIADRLLAHPKVQVLWNTIVTEIVGGQRVDGVLLKDLKTGEVRRLPCEGVFLFVGTEPNTGFLGGLVRLDERGYVLTDEDMATSVAGIFACGDVRKKLLRQVVTACGEGATAAYAAEKYVEKIKGMEYPGG